MNLCASNTIPSAATAGTVAANGRLESPLCTPNEIQSETGQLSPEFTVDESASSYTLAGRSEVAPEFRILSTRAVPYVPSPSSLACTFSTKRLNRLYSLIDNR
jgi:hypothetical protein